MEMASLFTGVNGWAGKQEHLVCRISENLSLLQCLLPLKASNMPLKLYLQCPCLT